MATIYGTSGNDTIYGGSGSDSLNGEAEPQRVQGSWPECGCCFTPAIFGPYRGQNPREPDIFSLIFGAVPGARTSGRGTMATYIGISGAGTFGDVVRGSKDIRGTRKRIRLTPEIRIEASLSPSTGV